HHRLRRASAGYSPEPAAHPRFDARDESAEREDCAGGAVFRPEDAQRHRPRYGRAGARAAALGWRHQGSDRLLQAVRLRRDDARERHQTDGSQIVDRAMLNFLAAPFAASLILTGIHAYLGVHVVERGVIFVDLSLAQIAA